MKLKLYKKTLKNIKNKNDTVYSNNLFFNYFIKYYFRWNRQTYDPVDD